MKKAEIVDASTPLRIVTVDIPETPKNGCRLKTTFAGVCHSDLHIITDEAEILPGKITRRRDVLPNLGTNFNIPEKVPSFYLFKYEIHRNIKLPSIQYTVAFHSQVHNLEDLYLTMKLLV